MDDRSAGPQRHVLTAGVDEMQILFSRSRERAVADHPVLGMEDDLLVAEIEIRAQGRDADTEIDDPAVAEFHRQPVAHLLAGKPLRSVTHLSPQKLINATVAKDTRWTRRLRVRCPERHLIPPNRHPRA